MKNALRFNPYLVIIHLLCLLILSYTLIIKSIFSSTDTLSSHLQQAGLYADTANLVKSQISANLAQRYPDRIVLRALSEKLLDAIVTPQFIEQRSERALTIATRIVSQPLDIANNKVIINTKSYKQRISSELNNRDLPDIIEPTVQNLVTAVPDQLTLVDMENRPNSILAFLTRAKLLYERINVWNTVALTAGIITGLLLIIINREHLRLLFKNLSIAYLISGLFVLIGSFLIPYIITFYNTGPNIYLNKLVSDAIYYLFAQTRTPAIILLGLGGIFYFLFRWSYLDRLQVKLDKLLHGSAPTKKKRT